MLKPVKTMAMVSTATTCVISRLTLLFSTILPIKQSVKVEASRAHVAISVGNGRYEAMSLSCA